MKFAEIRFFPESVKYRIPLYNIVIKDGEMKNES